jgi:hypothetical protein
MKNTNSIYLITGFIGIIVILIVLKCSVFSNDDDDNQQENMKYLGLENTRYWPYYYYSQPYNMSSGGGGWPPNMYSRMRQISPGFHSGSGLSHAYRPGMSVKYWPRSRWINSRRNGKKSYHNITNNEDWNHDVANYSY